MTIKNKKERMNQNLLLSKPAKYKPAWQLPWPILHLLQNREEMALIPHSQVFSSFSAINSLTNPFPKIFRTIKISASSSSSPNNSKDEQIVETDPVKLAFAKAKAYKKEIKPADSIAQNGVSVSEADDSDEKIALNSNTVIEGETDIFFFKFPLSGYYSIFQFE